MTVLKLRDRGNTDERRGRVNFGVDWDRKNGNISKSTSLYLADIKSCFQQLVSFMYIYGILQFIARSLDLFTALDVTLLSSGLCNV